MADKDIARPVLIVEAGVRPACFPLDWHLTERGLSGFYKNVGTPSAPVWQRIDEQAGF